MFRRVKPACQNWLFVLQLNTSYCSSLSTIVINNNIISVITAVTIDF